MFERWKELASFCVTTLVCVAGSNAARAASDPTTAPSASPRPTGLSFKTTASATLVDQNTSGPGRIGPEAPGFIAGSPLAPNTPYDLFSSAPQVPGIAGVGQLLTTARYGFKRYDATLTAGFGYVDGSTTNAAYWAENLMPTLNPHLGSQALPYSITFPTHPGQDDTSTPRTSILGASLATADRNLRVRGGYFDLAQSDRFVFAQPALTSVNPQIAYVPAESLSNGPASASFWQPAATALPLQGLDAVAVRGDATLEVTNAALPSLPGESARMTMGSIVFDRGEGTRFSAQLVHVATSGLPFVTTVPNGVDPAYDDSPQGTLPTSTLDGQRQTIAGARAAFHVDARTGIDGIVELGRAWYDASPVARPGTEKPGGFYHAGIIKTHNRSTASFDYYRMEPRYATLILPYGVAENQWSAAFAWPGQWLKSNYQLIDNSVLGVNRQGYRLRYELDGGPIETHLEYTDLHQIEPETTDTATQPGYVDGYYLPQLPNDATFGRQKRYGFWAAWHPAFGDLSLDIVDDTLYRPFAATRISDQVSYEVPQAVLTFSRKLSGNVTASTGLGRYAMKGAFSEPIDFAERLFFVGTQVAETPKTALLVTFRRTAFEGLSTFPAAGIGADFTGSAVIVEQRLQL
jgi:hypothetical protein